MPRSTPHRVAFRRQLAPRQGLAALALACALCSACRAVPARLGPDRATAGRAVDGLLGGISARFFQPQRDTRVRVARRLITLSMLTPSRIFDDTLVWHRHPDETTRLTGWHGYTEQGHYRFSAAMADARPTQPGDGVHRLRLRQLGDDEYEWYTTTEYGIGALSPAALAKLPVTWIAAGERADTRAKETEVRTAFARSTREWGRLFTIQSLGAAELADGSWRQHIVVTLHPDRATQSYAAFGGWLQKYVSPLRLRIRLRDSTHTWFDFGFQSDTLRIDMRSRDGRPLPLEGGDAAMPDTVTLDVDASARLRFLRVSVRSLRGEFVTIRDSLARGWSVHFASDPDWQLPLLTEQMLRTPLRRPFRGTGTRFRIAAESPPGSPQTLLSRQLLAPVEESAILRFLSRLVNTGIGDYVEGADRQTNEWLTAAFAALHADARDVLNAPATQTPPR